METTNHHKSHLIIFSVMVVLTGLVACAPPPPTFKITVIVDTATDPVSREDAEAVAEMVKPRFKELTTFELEVIEIVADERGGSIERIATDYLAQAAEIPNGILLFSVGDDDRAIINRAYAQRVPGPEGFCNPFVSPIPEVEDSHVYVAVLQFNYIYAACGYAGTDTVQSPFSSGDECRGVAEESCVAWQDQQVCPVALPFLEGKTRIEMAAEPVVHEFGHPFDLDGPDAHYGTEACNLAMGWEPDHHDEAEGMYNDGMCPTVWQAFANSYRP